MSEPINGQITSLAVANTDALKEAAKKNLDDLGRNLANYIVAQVAKLLCEYYIEHPDRGPLSVSNTENLTVCGDDEDEWTDEESVLDDQLCELVFDGFISYRVEVSEDGVSVTDFTYDNAYITEALHILED
jgi:hypothetical protein